MLPTNFHVNWPFSSGKEAKNSFKMATMVPILYFPSDLRRRSKNRFQNGCPGGHLGFSIDRILANFDLQVILMLPYHVSSQLSLLVQEVKRKIDFQDKFLREETFHQLKQLWR